MADRRDGRNFGELTEAEDRVDRLTERTEGSNSG